MIRRACAAACLAFMVLGSLGAAGAGGFNQFIGFGDSTLDTGYFRYHSYGPGYDPAIAAAVANGASGAFVGGGVMNSTILAGRFGLAALPSDNGGTNYANANTNTVTVTNPNNVSTIQQIENYLASVNGHANPRGLYVIKTGDNDLTQFTNQGAAFIAAHPDYLPGLASALASEVATLQAAGARTMIVRNSYNYAVFAALGGDLDSGKADAYARSRTLDAGEWSSLTAAGVRFIPSDIDSLMKYVVKHPTLFGFTASSVLAANAAAGPAGSALLAILTPEQQRDYLFADHVHFTTAGQTLEADYDYGLLVAPSQVSLLAESAVQAGLARARTIQGQIDLSMQHRGPSGVNAWASAGASTQDIRSGAGFPDASAIPLAGATGADYRTECGLVLGAAFSGGVQTQKFSEGGHFDQTDEAVSLYAAYQDGPAWGDMTATYGFLQDTIKRRVTLGAFTDRNHADTDGQSASLAVRGGYDFSLGGTIATGPVAGLVAQRVHLDGFTETGESGVTALSFGSQTRDSLVSQLGWRGSVDLGDWTPFVEAGWNHEWADRDRTVSASLTSAAAAPYSADGAPIASDWASATLGASYRLTPQVLLRGSVSAVFLNSQVTSFGGEAGLSVSF